MSGAANPRKLIDAFLEAWLPVAASAERLTGRVTLEADLSDWIALNMSIDDLAQYLRDTQPQGSGEYVRVDAPPKVELPPEEAPFKKSR